MQESFIQKTDAEDTLSDAAAVLYSVFCIRCLIERLLHPLFDRETSASAVY